MSLTYKEASFPIDYREAEVRRVMNALCRLRSIAINGLAGMGKSNLVRFIMSHPEARARYLAERRDDYVFVHVDCTALPKSGEAQIVGEIAFQLRRVGFSGGDERPVDRLSDPRRALREHMLQVEPDLHLVIVLDYFDQAAKGLESTFFNYLFHLRNSRPRGNLCYVFVTRRPMAHLGELQELLDDRCTVGPLTCQDALGSILRDEARLGCTFTPAQRERLIACTGGHPGLLKNATELLVSGNADASLPQEVFAQQQLQSRKVESLCQELWQDLTSSEQRILIGVAAGISLSPIAKSARQTDVAYLEESGILVRGVRAGDGDAGLTLFSPLFEGFVHSLDSPNAGAVRITAVFPNQARIATSTAVETVKLSPKLFVLLSTLAETEGQVLPTPELILRVYGSEALGVTDAALSQLVKRLRATLDPVGRRLTGDPTYTCVQTVRGVGYGLTG